MMPVVTDVSFKIAPARLQAQGLLGWTRFTLDGRYGVDGVAVRRSAQGKLHLSFPERVDAAGRRHALIHPLDDATRLAIEVQVFDALARDGRLAS